MYRVTRQTSLETFTYAFRYFVEALQQDPDSRTRGSLLRLSIILLHESAELAAKSLTGKFDAPYWEVFEHAFSHALGKPISPNSDKKKKKTYFQKIYDEGGLLACKDYRECLMYVLTHRLHELTKIRNKLYHEGGRVVELCNAYEFLRDVFAYFINIYGMKTLLNMIENLPLALKAWLLLSLKYFEKVEEKQVSEAYLIDSWKEISSSIERNLGVKLLRLLEQLFEGNKNSFSIISDKISQLKPFNIFEVMVVLKTA